MYRPAHIVVLQQHLKDIVDTVDIVCIDNVIGDNVVKG